MSQMRTDIKEARLVPDPPATPDVHGIRGRDEAWLRVPETEDVNAGFVPEAPRDGTTYGRNGRDGRWTPVAAGDALVHIGPTPPPAPQPGMLWWRNDPDATLYILVRDANGDHWAPASAPGSIIVANLPEPLAEPPADGRIYGRCNNAWIPIA
jgi:hypothetical protein